MKSALPYLTIIRPNNVLLTAIAVTLGFWLGHSTHSPGELLLLIAAGGAAAAFGNIVNDIRDIATDRISHPKRPLVLNQLSINAATVYSVLLGTAALVCSATVSLVHAAATAIPLLLLLIYTRYLKATPLAGNIIVSMLVAYALLFGALYSDHFNRLLIPAALAFLLNFAREIIKDLHDKEGDLAAEIITTANLKSSYISSFIYSISGIYLGLLFLPTLFHQFGFTYLLICLFAVMPLHCWWTILYRKNGSQETLSRISALIKWEMLLGLTALALDELITR